MAIRFTEENAAQEAVNAWTHGVGFVASLPAGLVLNRLAADHREPLVYACLIYSLSLTAMYLFSTLSHAVREAGLRHRVRTLDQGLIYVFIAGTFTPFVWAHMEGWARLSLLFFVWAAAATGFYSKVYAEHRIDNIASLSYIMLGWAPSMVLLGYVSATCFAMMAIGGLLYTLGTFFLLNDHRSWYYHAIWHTLVILASGCHYLAIAMFVVLRIDTR